MILFPYEKPDPARERQDLVAYAEAGHAPSQRVLADCYRIGDELTKRDYVEALRWYRLTAEQGDAALTVYSDLSRDEQAEAYRLVEVTRGPSAHPDTKGTGS